MEHLEIILPSALLILGFSLKLSVGRQCDLPIILQSLCELPVDITLLAISFAVAFTISHVHAQSLGLLYCVLGIVLVVINIVLWRLSSDCLLAKKNIWLLWFFVNLVVAGLGTHRSILMLMNNEYKIETLIVPTNSNKQNND